MPYGYPSIVLTTLDELAPDQEDYMFCTMMVRRLKEGEGIRLVVKQATGHLNRIQYADHHLVIPSSLRERVMMLRHI